MGRGVSPTVWVSLHPSVSPWPCKVHSCLPSGPSCPLPQVLAAVSNLFPWWSGTCWLHYYDYDLSFPPLGETGRLQELGVGLRIGLWLCPFLWSVVVQLLNHVWLFATHGLQHSRLPCPWLSPGVSSNSCHWGGDNIQPSHPELPSSPSAFSLSQQQGLFWWISSSNQAVRVLEL